MRGRKGPWGRSGPAPLRSRRQGGGTVLQFGEILTLAIALVAAAYLASNWRRVRSSETLRLFALPLILMILAWAFSIVEDLFPPGGLTAVTVAFRERAGAEPGQTSMSQVLNILEHVLSMAAAVALLWATWFMCQGRRERPR